MPRQKSALKRIEIDKVQRAHNCQHNQKHRLHQGDTRLKIWKERGPENFCVQCAIQIVRNDIQKLDKIARQIETELK